MTCNDFQEWIALDVAGDLPASEATRVGEHLKACASCRGFAEELSAGLEWLRSAHQQPPDPAALHQVRVGVMRQIEAEQSRWNRPFGGLSAIGWRWVAVTAAFVVLAGVLWWSQPSEQQQSVAALERQHKTERQPPNPVARPTPPASEEMPRSHPPAEAPQARNQVTPPVKAAEVDAQPEARREQRLAQTIDARETSAAAPSGPGRLETDPDIELVTAVLEEPAQDPKEAVMLKIPTSNPDIILYWLMDSEQQSEEDEESKGD
jgi:hypothetical protein